MVELTLEEQIRHEAFCDISCDWDLEASFDDLFVEQCKLINIGLYSMIVLMLLSDDLCKNSLLNHKLINELPL